MDKINLKIIAQDHLLLETEADSVNLETTSGQITILPKHAPLVTQLKAGEAVVVNNGQLQYFSVVGGFAEIANNQVLLLANQAELAEELDEDRALQAYERAKQRLANLKDKEAVDYANIAAQLEKQLSRYKIARKRRRSHEHSLDK